MQVKTQTQADEFTRIAARINVVIGNTRAASAETTHSFSKNLPNRSTHMAEVRRTVSPSPRMWNETLAFAADG